MSTPSNNSQMHNDIMAAGSRERPPMLAPGHYAHGVLAVPAVGDESGQPHRVQEETYANTTPENRRLIDAEAIHMILNEIGDDIYSTMDACFTTREMWLAIERLQQRESINKQDVNIKLFWEFGKFTSRDGESVESYYSRFYKMMNEMVRNKLKADTMQVNVQFLQQLQPEWSRIKKVDTSSRSGNDRNTGQFGNQRTATVASVLGLEKLKPKWAKDYEYHKEKMRLCKQESKGMSLSAEQDEWLHDIDDEPDEQELEVHYMYMANIQEVLTIDFGPTYNAELLEKVQSDIDYNVFATDRQHSEQPESINDTYVVEMVDSNVTPDSSDICDNEGMTDQNDEEPEDERVLLASLIANFKLDVDENKKPQKKLKKTNMSLTQELEKSKQDLEISKQDLEISKQDLLIAKKAQKEKPCLYNVKYDKNDLANLFALEFDETIRLAEESRSKILVDELQSDKTMLSKEYDILLQECVSKDIMCAIIRSFDNTDEQNKMQSLYLEKYEECENLKTELSKRNENVGNKSFNELTKKFAELEKHCISLELSLQHINESFQKDRPCKNQDAPEFLEFFKINELKAQLKDKNTTISVLKKLIAKMKGKSVDTKSRLSSFANLCTSKKAQKEKSCLYKVKYDKNDLANLFALEFDEIIRLAEESRSKIL
ncbi:hypothetical protein Tco_0627136 [Tanacetum coccineum]|uniref:Gag-Pol polyprotein n=1 Tax=Tanacetum coccineum TaxID=301880 RepID=A0ABQ4WLN2_9ASTR